MTPIALTIAGSDSSGGAGIQADLKAFSALGVYGASVITAITAQNTHGVTAIETLPASIIAAQIDAVLSDLKVGAIKIGMVSSVSTIETIADRLEAHDRKAIVDPVMIATSGDRLLEDGAVEALCQRLLPLAELATPNLPEAAFLTGEPVAEDAEAIGRQGAAIMGMGAAAVLVKGGHGSGPDACDLLFQGSDAPLAFSLPRLATTHDHGTGCTLAAAIAAGRAKGLPLAEAVAASKTYLHGAIAAAQTLSVGSGRGPVHHFYHWWPAL